MERGDEEIYVSAAQFTPEERFEFNLESLDGRVQEQIQNLPYAPCKVSGCTSGRSASINSIVNTVLSPEAGNRIPVPDILIIVSTSLYQIPELNPGELLTKPHSITHAFLVTVGNTAPKTPDSKLQFTATTSHLAAIDFRSLPDLVSPLCQSVASYLYDSKNGAGRGTVSTSTFVLVLVLLLVTALIFFLVLAYAVYRYRNENRHLRSQLTKERENFQKVDEYYRAKLREKSASEKEREKAMIDLITESNKDKNHYREQNLQQLQIMEQQKEKLKKAEEKTPILPVLGVPLGFNGGQLSPYPIHNQAPYPNQNQNPSPYPAQNQIQNPEIRGTGNRLLNENAPRREATLQVPPLSSEGDYERDELDEVNSKEFGFERTASQLPLEHPARTLPPVDVMLLVDASSSIGNTQFENVKTFLKDFTNDIDIAPGRSKMCVVLFAQEPQVFFGFDRFYSNRAVRSALDRLPYLGGPTYLARALSFAAGVFYQEQNMKSGRFRKHKFMPTPRHDRLQVMVVVSDGVSDDNFDKQATHLHERMLIKIAAVVTKSFNKDRLLPITRFDGSVFLLDQQQALSIWLWRQQKMWTENFAGYVEREKSLTNLMESSRQQQSTRSSPKKKKQPRPDLTK